MTKMRDLLVKELRSVLIFSRLPAAAPPSDVDAESQILSAIVNGYVTHADLAPLAAKHFYADVLRAIWTASEQVASGDVVGVRRALTAAGWRGALDEELVTIVFTRPFFCLPRLRDLVARVIELWARREMIRRMQELDVRLRHGLVGCDQARSELERFFGEVLG